MPNLSGLFVSDDLRCYPVSNGGTFSTKKRCTDACTPLAGPGFSCSDAGQCYNVTSGDAGYGSLTDCQVGAARVRVGVVEACTNIRLRVHAHSS